VYPIGFYENSPHFTINALLFIAIVEKSDGPSSEIEERGASGVVGILWGSRYLQTIATLIFLSVIAYPSTEALAGFFGSYYAWLSAVTLLAQLWLTGKLLMGLGLTPSLLLLPLALLGRSLSLLLWPCLFAATATKLAEASFAHERQSQWGGDRRKLRSTYAF
jgi:ATP/ADP translocase